MNWFKEIFCGKPCGSGGDEPSAKNNTNSVKWLYEFIKTELCKNPNLVACLETSYTYPHSTRVTHKKFWIRMIDSNLRYLKVELGLTGYKQASLTEENIFDVITEDFSKTIKKNELDINWKINWIDLDVVPKRSQELIVNALASAKPFTALPVFDMYHVAINDPVSECATYMSATDDHIDVPYWVSDLALYLEMVKLPEDPNAYRIIDELKVDPKLLPDTHWRKWVRVEPAVDNANAVMKYVPRDIARGKVQYFDVFFDFNEARLAGVAFATGKLLGRAIAAKITQLDREIENGQGYYDEYSGNYREPRKSDTYLKPEQIKLLWESRTYLIEEYFELERQSTTNLERPYLAPNQEVNIGGNKFSIDADYYINFTPWDPSK